MKERAKKDYELSFVLSILPILLNSLLKYLLSPVIRDALRNLVPFVQFTKREIIFLK